ncbi:MAG: hypothetical protein AAF616_00160 [Bacteroidota bacterium]
MKKNVWLGFVLASLSIFNVSLVVYAFIKASDAEKARQEAEHIKYESAKFQSDAQEQVEKARAEVFELTEKLAACEGN